MSNFAPQPADEISIATIRTLAADVVAKANSGHPGAFSAVAFKGFLSLTRCFRCAYGYGARGTSIIYAVSVINASSTSRSHLVILLVFSMQIQRIRNGTIVTDLCSPMGQSSLLCFLSLTMNVLSC
jgi:hypothetical protein